MLAYICNPNTLGAKAGGLGVLHKPGMHCELQVSLGYIVRPYLKTKNITGHILFFIVLFLFSAMNVSNNQCKILYMIYSYLWPFGGGDTGLFVFFYGAGV